jgi:hypothetical protein
VFAQGETGWFVQTLRKLTRRLMDVALAVRFLRIFHLDLLQRLTCRSRRSVERQAIRNSHEREKRRGCWDGRWVLQRVIGSSSSSSSPPVSAPFSAHPTGVHSTGDSPTKRDALFFLANSTFRVYFALSNLRLCDTVLNNTNNSSAVLDFFPKADRVAFLYYRGRIALYQRRLPQARNDLRRAFTLCHAQAWNQGRYVLFPDLGPFC